VSVAREHAAVDPITTEILRSGFAAVAQEMKHVLMRAAFSPVLSLSGDLSCAILDPAGEVVAQGVDIPVHLGAMPYTARGLLDAFPPEGLAPGDALLTNDPFSGGTHLPDMTLLSPVFDGDAIIAFAASRAHWPDVGGSAPGSNKATDEIYKEGLTIPPVKLLEGGAFNEPILRLMLANMRLPADRLGDLRAQIAANVRGVQRVSELVDRYGGDVVRAVATAAQDYSQARVEQALEAWPDGSWSHEEAMDGDGVGPDEPERHTLRVTVTKRGRRLVVDFAGTSPAVLGPTNAPIAVTASAAYYVALALFGGGDIPPNSGAYRPVEVRVPPGSLVDARPPSPVVAANTETANRIVDVLLGALAQSQPQRVPAASYGSAGVFTVAGRDPARDARFVHYETVGGGMGASSAVDGLSGMRVHMGNTMNLPVESLEVAIPVRVARYELVEGSGGDGRRRGGDGVRKVVRALVDGVECSTLGERARTPAEGRAGGGPGRRASFGVRLADGTFRPIPSKCGGLVLAAGDELWIETAGGGGWGDPAGAADSKEEKR
jgi:N-methylhydantoinase B